MPLIRDGARAESSGTVFPGVMHPSHTSIVTGVWPREHGLLDKHMTHRASGER